MRGKNLITIISKSTYCHHLYSKLQTPTLIPNRAKAKSLEIAKNTITLQMQFAYVVGGRSCRYLTCQMDFQMSYQRKSSQYCLFFRKKKGSKGNLIRIYMGSVSSQHNRPTGLHLKEHVTEHQYTIKQERNYPPWKGGGNERVRTP